MRQFRDAGFAPLGFDIYLGQMAFYYNTDEGIRARIDWDPDFSGQDGDVTSSEETL